MADALDSKSSALQRRVGSTPTSGTSLESHARQSIALVCLFHLLRVARAMAYAIRERLAAEPSRRAAKGLGAGASWARVLLISSLGRRPHALQKRPFALN